MGLSFRATVTVTKALEDHTVHALAADSEVRFQPLPLPEQAQKQAAE